MFGCQIRKIGFVFWIMAIVFSPTKPVFSRTLAQWKLLYMKEPGNTKILHYLAQGHLKEGNFKEALTWYLKLNKLLPESKTALAETARCYWGLGYSFKAYRLCRDQENLEACDQFLSEIQRKNPKDSSILEFQYELQSGSGFQMELAKELLKTSSEEPLFLDALGQYFFEMNLMEFAFDFWSLAPTVFKQKKVFFNDLSHQYLEKLAKKKDQSLSQEDNLFEAYYAHKFSPLRAARSNGPLLSEIQAAFEQHVTQRGQDRFENYYRLGYLACMGGLKHQCQSSFLKASERSPFRLYSFLMEATLKRLLKVERGVEIKVKGY